jgi:hypothetical protein
LSSPGLIALAMRPAIKPIKIVHIIDNISPPRRL